MHKAVRFLRASWDSQNSQIWATSANFNVFPRSLRIWTLVKSKIKMSVFINWVIWGDVVALMLSGEWALFIFSPKAWFCFYIQTANWPRIFAAIQPGFFFHFLAAKYLPHYEQSTVMCHWWWQCRSNWCGGVFCAGRPLWVTAVGWAFTQWQSNSIQDREYGEKMCSSLLCCNIILIWLVSFNK